MSSELDIGALAWVKSEIDHALERSGEALKVYARHPQDDTQIKFAKTHLHQARGALAIVGLDGVSQFSDAIEQLLAALEKGELDYTDALGSLVQQALADIRDYLDDLATGLPDQPIRLFPRYAEIIAARGGEAAPSELFFPDLSRRPPRRPQETAPADAAIPERTEIRRIRAAFQRGLLKWLKHDATGLNEMRGAIAAIELVQDQPAARAFWWSALGFLDALVTEGIAADSNTRRLCARIDGQARKLVGGSRTVAERLMRDVLYHVAVSTKRSEQIDKIRSAYALAELIPDEVRQVGLSPLSGSLRSMRELLGSAKEDWNRFSAGTAIALPQFHEHATLLAEQARALGQVDFARLLASIGSVANMLRKDPLRQSDSVALEIATALLLAESALDNFASLGVEFARQVDIMTGRLTALLREEALTLLEAPNLDAMSRRAQERLLMSQVAREVQTNLVQIEQALDAFFRDPARGSELAALSKPMKQIEGAFAMLGEPRAVDILRECEARVAEFGLPDCVASEQDFEDVASKLSALGFFIDQLQHGPADVDAILSPRPRTAQNDEEATEPPVASVEAEIAEATRQTQVLVEALREKPEDAELRGELQQNLESIRDDANLVANTALEQQANAAIAALKAATTASGPENFEQAVAQITTAPTPAAPSAETVRLAESSADEIDAELLDIFIEEAHEVLATIATNFERSLSASHDREALTTIRRGFHTLKGSGRMVGLTDLGETAWAVEQVMNHWLQLEIDATPALHDMIGQARGLFAEWVWQLEAGGGRHFDASALISLCEQLRGGNEPARAEPPVAVAPEPDSEPDSEPEPEPPIDAVIRIGESSLSPTLYDMYLAEARNHIATLSRDQHHLDLPPETEMIRAAHTLAGISGTVGIGPINLLAHELEGALVRLAAFNAVPTADQQALLSSAITALAAMVDSVAQREMPTEATALEAYLSGLTPEIAADTIQIDDVALDASTDIAVDMVSEEPVLVDAVVPEAETAEILPLLIADPESAPGVDALEATAELGDSLDAAELEPLAEPVSSEADIDTAGTVATTLPAIPTIPAIPSGPAPASVAEPAEPRHEAGGGESDRRHLLLTDDLDPQLLPIFLEEANDLLREIGSELRNWRAEPADPAAGAQIKRLLHTLKGSARMAGAMSVGELVHGMESRVEQIAAAPSAIFLDELDSSFDHLHSLIESAKQTPESPELLIPPAAAADQQPVAAITPHPALPHGEADSDLAGARALLRVRADLVDKLANEAGEMAIARSRIEGEMRTLKSSLLDLTENVIRLRNQLREIEIQAESQLQSRQSLPGEQQADFDPLEFDRFTRFQELTRMMAESVNDVTTIQHNLLRNLDHTDAALTAQARVNRELSQALMSVRMVPFNSIADRLYRIVRQTAKELDKRANLDIRGGQTELDRSVLEKMTGPLEHLLRNSISHGLESRAQRLAAGKTEIGQISLALAQEGNEVSIELADDGGGLDFARIRDKAVERGLITADQEIGEQQLTQLIFLSGFSTAESLTELAGRGVGMDVVKNEAAALGGRIEVNSAGGRGTTFRVLLPLTLAVTQAVLVRSGTHSYALPSTMVEQVQEMKAEAVQKIRSQGAAEWLGMSYAYHYLPRLLGDSAAQPQQTRRYWMLLLKAGTQRVSLEVDELLGNQEIVVKNIGAQLSRVVGIAGATVLGDGEIALILNPIALAGRGLDISVGDAASPQLVPESPPVATVPTVLVVDDSLTVRKITSRLLSREGYHVITAKDGVDALEQTLEIVPDVMLVDIEMPRMDGFDLTRNIRADARLKTVPIIMITSRIADKHRNYAKEIGVNHYLGKPFDEEELLRLIATYINRPSR